jgi:hypothetical protein
MKMILLLLLLLLLPSSLPAADIYFDLAPAGSNTGANCANARAYNSNLAGDDIPGNILHLCGTGTAAAGTSGMFVLQGSGSSGNVITVKFETGAILQAPYFGVNGAINTNGQSFILIDGGVPCGPNGSACNGVIRNTLNGTSGGTCPGGACSNQQLSQAIVAQGGSNIEIKNLGIYDLYDHTSSSDTVVDVTRVNCITFNGSNILVHDSTFHDVGWCLMHIYLNGDANVQVYNNIIFSAAHGYIPNTQHSGGSSGPFLFYGNHMYSFSAWDTAANAYHETGVHCYTSQTSGAAAHITEIDIYNNWFGPTSGGNMTAYVFLEGGTGTGSTPCMDSSSGGSEYNNVFISDHYINNGLTNASGAVQIFNNVVLGPDNNGGVCVSLAPQGKFENNVVAQCNQLVYMASNTGGAGLTVDYNAYGTASNAFVCGGVFYSDSQFSSWKTCVQGDSHSFVSSSLLLNSDGSPQVSSPVIKWGINLGSVSTGNVASLANDTTKGSTRTTLARPAAGSCSTQGVLPCWDIGAYQFSAAVAPVNGAPCAKCFAMLNMAMPALRAEPKVQRPQLVNHHRLQRIHNPYRDGKRPKAQPNHNADFFVPTTLAPAFVEKNMKVPMLSLDYSKADDGYGPQNPIQQAGSFVVHMSSGMGTDFII